MALCTTAKAGVFCSYLNDNHDFETNSLWSTIRDRSTHYLKLNIITNHPFEFDDATPRLFSKLVQANDLFRSSLRNLLY